VRTESTLAPGLTSDLIVQIVMISLLFSGAFLLPIGNHKMRIRDCFICLIRIILCTSFAALLVQRGKNAIVAQPDLRAL
jgi:hypothetical protein